jgi:hypothetical protein
MLSSHRCLDFPTLFYPSRVPDQNCVMFSHVVYALLASTPCSSVYIKVYVYMNVCMFRHNYLSLFYLIV